MAAPGDMMNQTEPFIEMDNTMIMSNQLQQGAFTDMPIAVEVEKWQQSKVGDYIEFKIKCTYQEGANEKPADDSQSVWYIYKRYSNFSILHDKLEPIFTANQIEVPEMPS